MKWTGTFSAGVHHRHQLWEVSGWLLQTQGLLPDISHALSTVQLPRDCYLHLAVCSRWQPHWWGTGELGCWRGFIAWGGSGGGGVTNNKKALSDLSVHVVSKYFVWACMFACVSDWVSICVWLFERERVWVCMREREIVCVCGCACMCTCMCVCVWVCMHVYMHACVCVCGCACMQCVCVHVWLCCKPATSFLMLNDSTEPRGLHLQAWLWRAILQRLRLWLLWIPQLSALPL